jgi:hypothetical protein
MGACRRSGSAISVYPKVRISDAVWHDTVSGGGTVLIRAELRNISSLEELARFKTLWFLDDYLGGGLPTHWHSDFNGSRGDAASTHWQVLSSFG